MKAMTGEFYDIELVAQILNDYCKQNKISKSVLANILGIHPTHISRVQAGICSPELLQKIAALGKREPKELILGVPSKIKQQLILAGRANNIAVNV